MILVTGWNGSRYPKGLQWIRLNTCSLGHGRSDTELQTHRYSRLGGTRRFRRRPWMAARSVELARGRTRNKWTYRWQDAALMNKGDRESSVVRLEVKFNVGHSGLVHDKLISEVRICWDISPSWSQSSLLDEGEILKKAGWKSKVWPKSNSTDQADS